MAPSPQRGTVSARYLRERSVLRGLMYSGSFLEKKALSLRRYEAVSSDVPGMHAVGTARYNTSLYEVKVRGISANPIMLEQETEA